MSPHAHTLPSLTHTRHAPATHAHRLCSHSPDRALEQPATGHPHRCRRRPLASPGLGVRSGARTTTTRDYHAHHRIATRNFARIYKSADAQSISDQAFLSRLVNVRARSGLPDRRADAAGQLAAGAYGIKVTSPDMAKYVHNRCRAESHRSYHCASSHQTYYIVLDFTRWTSRSYGLHIGLAVL
ncbi:hypothetical protein EXIGLDRAFT_459139 [Exidia glandulosa HHB12029]|uniref:Uncharacterized protein n=1 Tax=Exidia glandulosa HHB12029 TaxID=1314781 RepID=A0A165PQ61_EXIGL|nr:hypothetical protein EXIGLDRAFT_459139 [Exidia glandulosa HHB12029]